MYSKRVFFSIIVTLLFVLLVNVVCAEQSVIEQTNITHIRAIQTGRMGGQVFKSDGTKVSSVSLFLSAINGTWNDDDKLVMEIRPVVLKTTMAGDLRVYSIGETPVASVVFNVKADLLEKALALDKTIAEDGLWLDMSLGAKLDAGKDYVILGCLEPVKGEFRSIGFVIWHIMLFPGGICNLLKASD